MQGEKYTIQISNQKHVIYNQNKDMKTFDNISFEMIGVNTRMEFRYLIYNDSNTKTKNVLSFTPISILIYYRIYIEI